MDKKLIAIAFTTKTSNTTDIVEFEKECEENYRKLEEHHRTNPSKIKTNIKKSDTGIY